MQYRNTMLWESFHDAVPLRNPYDTPMDPRINVIDENWQRSKCDMLAISFESVCRQPSSIVGSHLAVLNLLKRNISEEMVIVYLDAYPS